MKRIFIISIILTTAFFIGRIGNETFVAAEETVKEEITLSEKGILPEEQSTVEEPSSEEEPVSEEETLPKDEQDFPDESTTYSQPMGTAPSKESPATNATTKTNTMKSSVIRGKNGKVTGSYKNISIINYDFRIRKKGKIRINILVKGEYLKVKKIKIKIKIQGKTGKKWKNLLLKTQRKKNGLFHYHKTYRAKKSGKYRIRAYVVYYTPEGKRKGRFVIQGKALKYKKK